MTDLRRPLSRLVVLATLLACGQPAFAADEPVVIEPVRLPSYETVRGIQRYATSEEYERARADQDFRLERMVYGSDGLRVSAYIYRPADASRELPVIVFNRGSWVVQDQAPVLLTMFRRLAAAGFFVIAPMLRGSDGTEGRDEMGGAELNDISNALVAARSRYKADFANLFLYGESRGGIMTFLALQRGLPVRAAATFGAITDFEQHFRDAPDQLAIAQRVWPDFERRKQEILSARSATVWTETLKVPMLLMHGGGDPQVSPGQTLALAARLQALKRPYSVVIHGYDNHNLTANRIDRDQRVVEWFKRHLQPPLEHRPK